MKKIILLIYLLNLNSFFMQTETLAQTRPVITGEYHLRGVMEMASGILLKSDSSFEFFFSYGAADRMGSGKWAWNAEDSTLTLHTAERHASDYALVKSRKDEEGYTAICLTDPNKYLLGFTEVRVHTANGIIEGKTDSHGCFAIPAQPIKQIDLLFQLCPERMSTIKIEDSTHTYFELRFEPWFADVYFDNVKFKVTDEGLKGGHPLMPGNEFNYKKLR